MQYERLFVKCLSIELKLATPANPSPALPFVRGGSYCINEEQSSSRLDLWRSIFVVAVLPSPNEGEGLGVRSATQVKQFLHSFNSSPEQIDITTKPNPANISL